MPWCWRRSWADLPLALKQAAAYIETAGIKLAGYRSLFLDRRGDLLAVAKP
jgi:hypothetical protein